MDDVHGGRCHLRALVGTVLPSARRSSLETSVILDVVKSSYEWETA